MRMNARAFVPFCAVVCLCQTATKKKYYRLNLLARIFAPLYQFTQFVVCCVLLHSLRTYDKKPKAMVTTMTTAAVAAAASTSNNDGEKEENLSMKQLTQA